MLSRAFSVRAWLSDIPRIEAVTAISERVDDIRERVHGIIAT